MDKDEMKNRISLALTDPILQQGFEIICKENAELIQENEEMKKGLGCETCQIHLEYMRLNNKIADFEKESTELKAGRDINVFTKQLTNAKEIISEYINILKGDTKNWKKTQEKAEQFLKEE